MCFVFFFSEFTVNSLYVFDALKVVVEVTKDLVISELFSSLQFHILPLILVRMGIPLLP